MTLHRQTCGEVEGEEMAVTGRLENPHIKRSGQRRKRAAKLLGFLAAGHGAFVLLKLLGIAALVALLGALDVRFGFEAVAIGLLHLAAIIAVVLAFSWWRRKR